MADGIGVHREGSATGHGRSVLYRRGSNYSSSSIFEDVEMAQEEVLSHRLGCPQHPTQIVFRLTGNLSP